MTTQLVSVSGEPSHRSPVAAVHQGADRSGFWGQLLGRDGQPGATVSSHAHCPSLASPLVDACAASSVYRAFGWPDGSVSIASTHRSAAETTICWFDIGEPLDPSASPVVRCQQEHGETIALARVADRYALLRVDLPREYDAEREPTFAKRPPNAGKDDEPGPEREILIRWLRRDGEAEPVEGFELPERDRWDDGWFGTGLRFEPPQAGMSLIDAQGRGKNLDLLWFERIEDKEITGKDVKLDAPLGWAGVAAATLSDGAVDPLSRADVTRAPLEYGGLRDKLDARQISDKRGSVFIARQWKKGPCVGRRAAPRLGPTAADRAFCAVDPCRFATPAAIEPKEQQWAESVLRLNPMREIGQPDFDSDRVVWAGDDGYFLREEPTLSLWTVHRGESPMELTVPLVSRRSTIRHAVLDERGAGLAWGADSLSEWGPDGLVKSSSATVDTMLQEAEKRATTAGAGWVQSADEWIGVRQGDRLTRLAHSEGLGHWVEFADIRLAVRARGVLETLTASKALSATATVEGAQSTAAWSGWGKDIEAVVAVRPLTTGALVIARAHPSVQQVGTLAVFVGVDGKPTSARWLSKEHEPGEGTLLTAPNGTSIWLSGRAVTWLTDAGEIATSALPAPALAKDGCAPIARMMPAPNAGTLVDVPELVQPGTCVLAAPRWLDDEHLRFVIETDTGAQRQVELVTVAFSSTDRKGTTAKPLDAGAGVQLAAAEPRHCPPDMVEVPRPNGTGSYCVDRFESTIVDSKTGWRFSPDAPTTPNLLSIAMGRWAHQRSWHGDIVARSLPLPFIDRWQYGQGLAHVARSRGGVFPNGYLTGLVAAEACEAAGKRLCSEPEFVHACRGEDNTLYPYGASFQQGACNVFRPGHPAAALHGHASVGHLDPRLHRASVSDGPGLMKTGAQSSCRSRWGDDAIYDMVGNLDEWIDNKGGAFAGGFYSRSTRAGCKALVDNHPTNYLDYSTGVRCCMDAASE